MVEIKVSRTITGREDTENLSSLCVLYVCNPQPFSTWHVIGPPLIIFGGTSKWMRIAGDGVVKSREEMGKREPRPRAGNE